MEISIQSLVEKHKSGRVNNMKAVFASLFVVQNRLQTIFDNEDNNITLKQFLLIIMLKQGNELLTLTKLGELLGCSRQNVKKLAISLEKKGFVTITQKPADPRACLVKTMPKLETYLTKVENTHAHMLNLLFKDYSDTQMQTFFELLNNMFAGLENMETNIKSEETT